MSADFASVQRIFLAAVDRHPLGPWDAYLDEACASDLCLRLDVAELLQAHLELSRSHDGASMAGAPDQRDEGPGSVIGPYTLQQQIGEGGMGAVFMAVQTHPLQRHVALKIIKPGMDSRQVIGRFDAERQALALMDHPNIAKVLDAGTTQSGRPYFAMELVTGVPITRYCDAHRLTLRQRLELLVPVCQAVQHAHQKGIIHRDLKPSNVLVAEYDGKPVAKVIDFGVAKATGPSPIERTMCTQLGQIIGTLEYMSPEQATLNTVDIDTRSDIYALGVLLYELLTGATPFDEQRLRHAAFDEMLRMIREEEPPRPSTRLRKDEGGRMKDESRPPGRTGWYRRLQFSSFIPHPSSLQELDWIVMKCLEKDRNRRYETANGLATDLERYLHDEPVRACPPSAGYRLRKFVRRNRTTVLAAGLLVVALLAGIVGTTLGLVEARSQRDAAEAAGKNEARERAAAVVERDRALKAEKEKTEKLLEALHERARAGRWSGRPGRRFDSLKALGEAATIARDMEQSQDRLRELRNEAIACLALVDVKQGPTWEVPDVDAHELASDPECAHHAFAEPDGTVHVRQTADAQDVALLKGFGARVQSVAFSPNGQYLAVNHAGNPNQARVWDWRNRRVVTQCAVRGGLSDGRTGWMAWAPDGRRVAFHRTDDSISVTDLIEGKECQRLPKVRGLYGMAFHPAGTRLAISHETLVSVHDLDREAPIVELRHPGRTLVAAWRGDGELLAVPVGAHVHVWEMNSPTAPRAILKGHQSACTEIVFHHDGHLLLSTGWDGTVRIWDPWIGRELLVVPGATLRTWESNRLDQLLPVNLGRTTNGVLHLTSGRELRTLYGHAPTQGSPWCVDFSPDARLLASAGNDGVLLWDVAAGRPVKHLPVGPSAHAQFQPGGTGLLTFGVELQLWPLQRDPEGALHTGTPQLLGLADDPRWSRGARDRTGQRIALVQHGRARAAVINLDAPSHPVFLQPHPDLCYIAMSPNGRWVATARLAGTEVKVWDAQTGREMIELPVRGATLAFSPDDQWLVTGTTDAFRFWKTESWQPDGMIARPNDARCGQMAFTHDGRLLAVARTPRLAQLIDVATCQEIAVLSAPNELMITAFCFSPDDSQLAVATENQAVQLWDLRAIRRQLAEIGLDWDLPASPIVAAQQHALPGAEENPTVAANYLVRSIALARKDAKLTPAERIAAIESRRRHLELIYVREIASLEKRADAVADNPGLRRLVADAHGRYARLLTSAGLVDAAERAFGQQLEILDKLTAQFPKDTRYRVDAIENRGLYAQLLEGDGRRRNAEAMYDQVVHMAQKLEGDSPGQEQATVLATWVSERGHFYSRHGEYEKAVAAEARVLELLPDYPWPRFSIAANLLLAGDKDGYRRTCAEGWQRFGDGKNRFAVTMVARACGLAPDALTDSRAPVQAMSQVVTADPTSLLFFLLGLAHYRAGQWDEAIGRFEASISANRAWHEDSVQSGLGLALAHYRRGDIDKARQWLSRSVDRLEQGTRDKGLAVAFPAFFPDWATCRILRAEAEALIGKTAPKTDTSK
jgi:serine/threonine protein kinase/WD40 repeat protein/tetratricopeptide (TPR) repeat protein